MKPIIIYTVATFLLFNVSNFRVNGQQKNDSTATYLSARQGDYSQYLKRSHGQKVAGTIMAVSGGALLITGTALGLSGLSHLFEPGGSHPDYGSAPDILIATGGALCVSSVILFITSRKNKKLANLYMQKEKMSIAPGIKQPVEVVSLGIKLKL